jgi:peptidoglycan/LPS O-acetylase OafA/YrhL
MIFDAAFAYIVIYLGFLNLPVLPAFSKYGDFSYGMYLYAFPIQQLCLHMLGTNPDFPLFLITSFLLTLFFAVLSWHFIEEPALAHKS